MSPWFGALSALWVYVSGFEYHPEHQTVGARSKRGALGGPEQPATPFFVRGLGERDLVLVSGTRDQRIAAIAERQRGRVARRQLLAAGVSRNMIHTMLHTGLLVARHRGVYAFGHAAPGEPPRETEALLAIRVPAFLSAGFSLALWSLAPPPHPSEPVEITIIAPHSIR